MESECRDHHYFNMIMVDPLKEARVLIVENQPIKYKWKVDIRSVINYIIHAHCSTCKNDTENEKSRECNRLE